jgi:hypothetical protein
MKPLKSFCNTSNISMFAAAVAAALTVGTASAARPDSIGNTTWTLQTNIGLAEIVFSTQGNPGAPGAATCRVIDGKINIDTDIDGWYCPSNGRIHFIHKNQGTDATVRVFFGVVAGDALGVPVSMDGVVTVLNSTSAFGDLGEYNFSATPAIPATP